MENSHILFSGLPIQLRWLNLDDTIIPYDPTSVNVPSWSCVKTPTPNWEKGTLYI